ncbi:MAG: hypothetical protein ACLFT3_14930 [Cyclobacteriaceae bacterium]
MQFTVGKLIAYMNYLKAEDICNEGETFLYRLKEQLFNIGEHL